MRSLIMCVAAFICSATTLTAQVSYTANDIVPAYNGLFNYGINGGWYQTWDSKSLADIAAGNPSKNIPGLHSRSFRTLLRSVDIAQYGYNYNMFSSEYQYYVSLGIRELTAMVEMPAAEERDSVYWDANNQKASTNSCGQMSVMFKNMYSPIWDGGANGTPYNDTNYYAKFVYKIATTYKDHVKFWEIINEPDYDNMSQAWLSRGMANNWWENLPNPCALRNLFAPVFYYIRMMRIAYDVIKTVDPTAYVCPGGIGYVSFLDNLCRFTDNPVDGSVTPDYPLPATAYFDVLSFHSYPQYAMGEWSNAANGFVYQRNSDRGIKEFVKLRNDFDSILNIYGYNGTTYPKKIFICTETNIASRAFGVYVGSDEAQTNYIIKVLVASQKHNVVQTYPYVMGDGTPTASATESFELMGLYECLTNLGPNGGPGYKQVMKSSGIGYKTTATILDGSRYDAARTAAMNLPSNIDGAAFTDTIGGHIYVLWAKATGDNSEWASATYSFPAAMSVAPLMQRRLWNWSITGATDEIQANSVALTGTPIFLSETFTLLSEDETDNTTTNPINNNTSFVNLYPNPAKTASVFAFTLTGSSKVNLSIFNAEGKLVATPVANQTYSGGTHTIALPVQTLVNGVYYCRFKTDKAETVRKLVITK